MRTLLLLIFVLILSFGVLAVNSFVLDNGSYKAGVDVKMGWNLVYAFDDDSAITSDSEIQFSNIKSRWLFSPQNQKFYDMTSRSIESAIREAESDTGTSSSERRKYFGNAGVWFYSDKAGKLRFITTYIQPLDQVFLKEGWNLVSITPEFVGYYIYDIKGSCEFEKIYGWDASQQKWAWKGFSSVFFAQAIKVSNDCYLGLIVPRLPAMPELQNTTSYSNIYLTLNSVDKTWYGSWGKITLLNYTIQNLGTRSIAPSRILMGIEGYETDAEKLITLPTQSIESGRSINNQLVIPFGFAYNELIVGDLSNVEIHLKLLDTNNQEMASFQAPFNLR